MDTETRTRAAAMTDAARIALHQALDVAESPGDFLGRADAILIDPTSRLELPVDLGRPDPLDPTARQGGIDSENAILVHQYLGEMDRANAADPRLWNYLALVTYREYMEARWPLDGRDGWRNRARDRWLIASPSRGRLIRHGIARLWWVAHLTFDREQRYTLSERDPYGYTREIFRNEDRIIATLDREIGALDALRRAVLERAALGGEAAKDVPFRDLMRTFNAIQGYRDIGLIPTSGIQDFVRLTAEARSD